MAKANISAPDVIKDFRNRWIKFDDEAKQALASIQGDVQRVTEWLRREQLAHWKRELRRRHEKEQTARQEYVRAIQGDKYAGKSSGVDERKLVGWLAEVMAAFGQLLAKNAGRLGLKASDAAKYAAGAIIERIKWPSSTK